MYVLLIINPLIDKEKKATKRADNYFYHQTIDMFEIKYIVNYTHLFFLQKFCETTIYNVLNENVTGNISSQKVHRK